MPLALTTPVASGTAGPRRPPLIERTARNNPPFLHLSFFLSFSLPCFFPPIPPDRCVVLGQHRRFKSIPLTFMVSKPSGVYTLFSFHGGIKFHGRLRERERGGGSAQFSPRIVLSLFLRASSCSSFITSFPRTVLTFFLPLLSVLGRLLFTL